MYLYLYLYLYLYWYWYWYWYLYVYLLGLQDVLSVVDVNGDKVYFINKLTGHEITKPYTRKLERIYGICMYDDETQPQLKGIIILANKYLFYFNKKTHTNRKFGTELIKKKLFCHFITFYWSSVALIGDQVQTGTSQILKRFCTLHDFTIDVQHRYLWHR